MADAESAGGNDSFEDDCEFRLSMSDVYYLLLADLSEVSELVENAKRHANENQPMQSLGSFMKAQKHGHDNQKDVLSLFKKQVMETVCHKVEDARPLGEPLHTAHVSLELRRKLLERVKKDRATIQQMSSELSQLQDSNKEILRRTEEFQKIVSQRASSGEMKTKLKWQDIGKKIKLQRAKLVSHIRHVTDNLCPGSEIPDMLAETLRKSLSGNDPYITVDDSSAEDVEFLLRCNLVVRHPHNRLLIRLRDLV